MMDIMTTHTDQYDITEYPENCLKMVLSGKKPGVWYQS